MSSSSGSNSKPPMSPTSRRLLDDVITYSNFRRQYPSESEEIKGMQVPKPYRGSVPKLLEYANDMIKNGKGRSNQKDSQWNPRR